jgi:ABC-type transport system involved in multi-copper enzyme maturation permease subunit
MIWTAWRQHRLEGLWALVAVALLAAAIAYVTHELSYATCARPDASYCLPSDAAGALAGSLMRINLAPYALALLPALAGAFIGAPMVAREIETGTERLAFTQDVSRVHWLLVKLGVVFVPLLAGAAVLGFLEVLLINAEGPQANHWDFFDQQAPVTIASTAFALALGVAVGSIVGKVVPAMALTLIGFVVTRVGIAELARAGYVHPLTTLDPSSIPPTAWWVNSAEQVAGPTQIVTQYYQPADRFWTFQAIESGILIGLTAAILVFAVYWVTRRLS